MSSKQFANSARAIAGFSRGPALDENEMSHSERGEALRAAISAAIALLASEDPGGTAILHVCRGAPLCDARHQPPGFNAACAKCERISVSDTGEIGYPGAGSA